jgi:hypothetical protein
MWSAMVRPDESLSHGRGGAEQALGAFGQFPDHLPGGQYLPHRFHRFPGVEGHGRDGAGRVPGGGWYRELGYRYPAGAQRHFRHDVPGEGLASVDAGPEYPVRRVGPHAGKGLGHDGVVGRRLEQGIDVLGVGVRFRCGDEPGASRAPAAPAASTAATPRAVAMPPAATTGTSTESSTESRSGSRLTRPRTCPPASVP